MDKGQPVFNPLRTITACDGQFGVVKVNLSEYGKAELHHWPEVRDMLNAYCGYDLQEDEIALLEIKGKKYFIRDIAIRMLTPRELYNAMGFPEDYIIDKDIAGKKISRAAQVARCGNAVCPAVAEALARANIVGTRRKIKTMDALAKTMCS